MKRLRILLIDDHTLFREGLARLLEKEPEFEVVANTASVAEGRHALGQHAVDLVLLDYDLGNELGTELLAGDAELNAGVRTVLVTAGMRQGATQHAIAAGVNGIVLKHSDPGLLVEAIRRVAAGETWIDPNAAGLPAGQPALAGGTTARSLTQRQRLVLRGILDGLANKEIAAKLQVSESAIKATIQELFHKAGVRTRSQLVRMAIERYSLEWLREEPAAEAERR